jgi:Spy/CpxP family protein refolding chaperone
MKLLRAAALCAALIAITQNAVAAQKGRHHRGGPAGLLMMPEVQRELRLDSEQLDRLENLHRDMGTRAKETFSGIQNLPREEREKRFFAFGAEYNRRIAIILDDRQEERLKQLDYQRGGVRSLGRPDVAAELKLSSDQRDRIKSIFEAEHGAMKAAVESIRSGTVMTPPQREEIGRKFREVRQQTDARLLQVLTERQERQWQSLQGPPFKFPEFRGRGK